MTECIAIDPSNSVLILVDLQPDFMPGGPLSVRAADVSEIVAPVRELMGSGIFPFQVATQDWHPPGHVSFATSHPGQRPFDTIRLHGHPQTLWPDHCVQGSPGAAIHPELDLSPVSAIVRKGEDARTDSYSAFRNNWCPSGDRPPTGLAGYLRERGIETVYCCGLARDFCVAWTAKDAAASGFRTWVIWDLTWPVDPGNDEPVRSDLQAAGIGIVTARELVGA